MPNIVILGGNFAGVSTAKYLLKKVLPAVDSSETQHKVTLVSPSAWTFFKVAAPRILAAEEIPNEKAFAPIQDSFSEYSLDQFTFIQGEAVGLDEETKTVSVKGADATSSLVKYDYLVIATGTTSVRTCSTPSVFYMLTTSNRLVRCGHCKAITKLRLTRCSTFRNVFLHRKQFLWQEAALSVSKWRAR